MISGALPDLALMLRQQQDTLRMRAEMQARGTELTTGQTADLSEDGRGLVSAVFGIDRDIDRLQQITFGLSRAQAEATAAQAAMGVVGSAAGTLGVNLEAGIGRGDAVMTPAFRREAEQVLDQVVGALNIRFGGRSLFAGTGVDGGALAPSEDLVAAIAAEIAGAADTAAAFAAIDAYMTDPGAGFETDIYQGTFQTLTGAALPDGTRASPAPRADDPAFRALMGAAAAIVAADTTAFGGDRIEQQAFMAEAARRLRDTAGAVIEIRALFGQSEERISDGLDAAETERSVLRMTRNDLVGKDPFVAATEFTALEGQLQSLYTVTSRLSALSLTNFLR